MGRLFILIPFHVIAAFAYIATVFSAGVGWLRAPILAPVLPSGERILLTGEGLMIILTVLLLMVEGMKSVLTGWASITNHILSAILFIAAFGALITTPMFSTFAWLIIVLTMFADMVIGAVVTAVSARRDFDVR